MKSRLAEVEEPEIENSERWLLTYADMITLLLALFIVLFAVSTINTKKFEALALGFKQSFSPNPGVLPSSNGVEQYDSLTPTAGPRQVQQTPSIASPSKQAAATSAPAALSASAEKQLSTIDQKIVKAITAKGLQAGVTTSVQTRGLVVQVLTNQVFFASDSAQLGPQGEAVVDTIASVLKTTTNGIDVEGYTDDQPITGGPYSSNEELSAVRAASVVTRLTDQDGLDPDRLAATGFGSTDAVAPNDTPADRALNRRIDFVILTPGGEPAMSAVATELAPEETAGKEVKVKKSKKKMVMIMVVVLLLGGFEAKSILLKPHYAAGEVIPLGTILPLDQLTVNMSDGHLVQASISLQLTKLASKAATADVPRFDDAAITVIGAETYDALLAPGGRNSVKAQILALAQKILPPIQGVAEQVSAVYFTSFVVQ